MRVGSYGRTLQGRELPYAIFSRPHVTSPAEAHATGKPVVVLGANAHGHNYVGREALLILLRELGSPGTEMDSVIVMVVPSKNPDGLVLESRYTSRGADLNRDYMTLDQPAMAAYAGNVVNHWNPHLFIDGHDGGAVQYGGAYPYHLLYQGPGLAGNYGGLANEISILFEFAAWPGLETGVEVGVASYRSILTYARDHGDTLTRTVQAARDRTVGLGRAGEGQVAVEERMAEDHVRVTYRIAHPEQEGLLTVRDAPIMKHPVGTRFRDRPVAYILPPAAEGAVALLRRHRIQVERLLHDVELDVHGYTMVGIQLGTADNAHRAAPRIEVGTEVALSVVAPQGSWIVRTGQPLGRVVTRLLEPENTDNVFYWDRMTFLLPLADLEAFEEGPGSLAPAHLAAHGSGSPTDDAERVLNSAWLRRTAARRTTHRPQQGVAGIAR